MPLVLDLRITHELFGSSSDPSLNGHLHYPNDIPLGGYIVNSLDCYSYRIIGKLTVFLQLQEFSLRNQPVDYSTSVARRSLHSLKLKVGSTLAKATSLRVNLNIDGAPITSRTHTHPSHTSSLSLT